MDYINLTPHPLTFEVPDHVTFEQRAAAVKALGLDPAVVRTVLMDAGDYKITVEVQQPSPRGGRPVTVKVTIPVVRGSVTDDEGPF